MEKQNTTLKQYINTTQERPHDIFIINGVILKRDEIYETYTGAEVVHNENTEVLLSNPPKYRYMVELEPTNNTTYADGKIQTKRSNNE